MNISALNWMRSLQCCKSVHILRPTGACWSYGYKKISMTPRFDVLSSFKRGDANGILSKAKYSYAQVPNISTPTNKRFIWGWLNAIFNKVDISRIEAVGSDKACAEWLLRCGAAVKWQNKEMWTKDYNSLAQSGGRGAKIEEIDATDAAVMHIGFPHFKGCKHIKRIVFHKAIYLEDAGMALLPLLQGSLRELQVSSCGNVTAEGLRHIKKLKNLENLLMFDLPEIRDKDAMQKELQEALPNCTVVFPYAQAEDDPNLKPSEEKK